MDARRWDSRDRERVRIVGERLDPKRSLTESPRVRSIGSSRKRSFADLEPHVQVALAGLFPAGHQAERRCPRDGCVLQIVPDRLG